MCILLSAGLLAILPTINSFLYLSHPTIAIRSPTSPRTLYRSLHLPATDGNEADGDERDLIESLQQKLTYIQALEERNKAQLDSFVDEEDQWESMEEFERELLSSKEDIEKQLDELMSEK